MEIFCQRREVCATRRHTRRWTHLNRHLARELDRDKVGLWAVRAAQYALVRCVGDKGEAANALPERLGVVVREALRAEPELERRDGPAREVPDVRPRQLRRDLACTARTDGDAFRRSDVHGGARGREGAGVDVLRCMMGAPLSPVDVSVAPFAAVGGSRRRATMGAPAAPGVPPGAGGGAALALAICRQKVGCVGEFLGVSMVDLIRMK